jgi:hypothetical protein
MRSISRKLGRALWLLVPVGLLFLWPATAHATGADTISYTQTFHDVTDVVEFTDPCTGIISTVTITYDGVNHVVIRQSKGTLDSTFNITGDFVQVFEDGSTITGHFTDTATVGGDVQDVFGTTLNIIGTTDDGEMVTEHFILRQVIFDDHVLVYFEKGCD